MQFDLENFDEHELVQIVYTSRSLVRGTQAEISAGIADILEKSRSENRRHGVTGVLFFNGRGFAQALEGPPREIANLYANILRDRRHADVRLLHQNVIKARCFESWAMAYVAGTEGQAFLIPSGFLRDVMRQTGGAAGSVLETMRYSVQDR